MPVFQVEIEGKPYEVDAPSQNEAVMGAQTYAKQTAITPDALVRQAVRGIPVVGGLANKFAAAMDAATYGALGRGAAGPSFGERYGQNVAAEEGRDVAFEQANPVTSTAAQLVGGVGATAPLGATAAGARALGITGPTLAGRAAAGATTGAALGAADAAARGGDIASGAVFGGALGGGAPIVAKGAGALAEKIVSPFKTTPEHAAAAQLLQNEGVRLTAPAATGSKKLSAIQSELGGARYAEATAQMHEDFSGAALRRAGLAGETRYTPDILNTNVDRVGNIFDTVAANNPIINLGSSRPMAQAVLRDFKDSTGTDAPILRDFIDRVWGTPTAPKLNIGATMGGGAKTFTAGVPGKTEISGTAYQTIRSELLAAARKTTDWRLRSALNDLATVLNDAVQAGLKNPADAKLWSQARREWFNHLVLEKAVSGSSEAAAQGLVTPVALRSAIESMKRGSYAKGKGDFADIARAGIQTMKPFQDSGTASRLAARAVPAAIGAMLGGGISLPGALGAAVGAPIAGRAIMSAPVQRYLSNQRGLSPDQLRRIGLGVSSIPPAAIPFFNRP